MSAHCLATPKPGPGAAETVGGSVIYTMARTVPSTFLEEKHEDVSSGERKEPLMRDQGMPGAG